MARTKASVGAKVSSGKNSKARALAAPLPLITYSGSSGRKSSCGRSRGNPVCRRDIPKWQKPITYFFGLQPKNSEKIQVSQEDTDTEVAGTSMSKKKSKHNVIESDNQSDSEPLNDFACDTSLELEPLNGESSHKILEYYKENDHESNKDVNENHESQENDNVKGVSRMNKEKGKGKKRNIEKLKSLKRDFRAND